MAAVRYLVNDVSESIRFYEAFGFELKQQFGPAMAIMAKADLTLWLADLRAKGVRFRNEIFTGPGGSQILCEDPSGSCLELFQPRA